MHVTRGWEECTLEMADRARRESETIKKVCNEGKGCTRFSPGIENWFNTEFGWR